MGEREGSIIARSDAGVQERLSKARVEIRLADLDRDAAKIANLFSQPSIIGHLSGIAPSRFVADKWNRIFEEQNTFIVPATPEGIKDLYESYNNNGLDSKKVLLVAENKEQIVGTVAVVKYTDPGLTYHIISQLDVDQYQRRRGIGRKLLRTADALIFLPRNMGGLGGVGAETGVIGINEGGFVGDMFKHEGYRSIGTQRDFCVSWDRRAREFPFRDSDRFQITRQEFFDSLQEKRVNIADLRKLLPKR
jgi:hypothetical protein